MAKASGTLIVAIMKNEAPYILEWVAHHLALGVEDFIIFSANCDDGTDHMLERLDRLGYMRHAPNPKRVIHQIGSWQVAALRYATAFNRYQEAKWVLTIDADEYVDVAVGDHRLEDLHDAAGSFDLMSFCVLGHNSNRIRHIGDGRVQGVFTRPNAELSALDRDAAPRTNAVKTIMRLPQQGAMFRNHRPKFHDFPATNQTWVDGSGQVLPPDFTNQKVNSFKSNGRLDYARVNHYSIRSMDSFLVKVDRGNAMEDGLVTKIDEKTIATQINYWTTRNQGLDNTPIKHNVPRGYDEIYHTLSTDPLLAELHERSLAVHKAKAERMLGTEGGQRIAEAMGYFDKSGADGAVTDVA